MDVGTDFLQPEFLNLLFFQQKNLVIFPYIDLKHLHALETFTVGHNIIDIESTALYNLREIIEGETINSYSQNPNLFLIYNLDDEKIKDIIKIEGIRCILNANENVSQLANGQAFIFYNKKTKTFINYEFKNGDLEFEKHLITTSKDQETLSDAIQKVKAITTRIFKDYVENGNINSIATVLSEYPKQYWRKILMFTEAYFDINLPEIDIEKLSCPRPLPSLSESNSPFFFEYQGIIEKNRILAKEFIHCLYVYRESHVNPANLELEQLYFPQNLFTYLREHHWKNGISKHFLKDWVKMKHTNVSLDNELKHKFMELFMSLDIPMSDTKDLLNLNDNEILSPIQSSPKNITETSEIVNKLPSFQNVSSSISSIMDVIETKLIGASQKYKIMVSEKKIKDFPQFKNMLLHVIEDIENKVNNPLKNSNKKKTPVSIKKINPLPRKKLIFIVDGANVARADIKSNQKDSLDQIKQVRNQLLEKGAERIYILYDPSLKYSIDDKDGLLDMVDKGLAKPTPARVKADDFILQHAKRIDAYIISNDKFDEEKYISHFSKEWISEKRCTFDVLEGNVALHFKVDDIIQSFYDTKM